MANDALSSLAGQRKQRLLTKVATYHEQLPGIRKLPLAVLGIIGLLVIVNVVVWIAAGVILVSTSYGTDFRSILTDVRPLIREFGLSVACFSVLTFGKNVGVNGSLGVYAWFASRFGCGSYFCKSLTIVAASVSFLDRLSNHVQAIDLMTRRLIADGQRPVTVGTFFSLGHSTSVLSLFPL